MMLAIIEHAWFFGLAIRLVHHAPFGFVKAELRLGAHDIGPRAAMGETRMHRIHAVLDALQPVAVLKSLDRDVDLAFANQEIVARHKRHRLWTEVSEDQTAQFFDRIRRQANVLFFERAVGRLARNLHQLAARVIKPTMIAAAQTVALDVAETQVGAPVRAEGADHASPPSRVAEQHEIFTKHTNE